MQYITLLDYLILPFVLLAVYALAYRYRNKHYGPRHPYRNYFIPGLTVKIAAAVLIGLIYAYYYKGGDTFNFFYHSKVINSAFADSPVKWVNLLLRRPEPTSIGYYQYISQMEWYGDPSSYMVAAFAAFISLLFANTYLPTAVIFAVISFSGSWAMFRAFAGIYPKYIKQVAIAMLFVPGVVIWGSGIFKDTICLAALGWLTYSVFQILVKRNLGFKNLALVAISLYLTYMVKLYILMAFIPALLVWVMFIYTARIRSAAARAVINLSVFALIGLISFYTLNLLGREYLGKYSIENITETAQTTAAWINYSSGDEGSAYDLGDISTPGQMLAKLPLAVNVTLFRPYLWESRKVIVLISALESFLFLLLTLKVFFAVGPKKVWKTLTSDPTIQFCLIFTVIFAFAVGISTYNFGALSRYKIPCIPFYALFLLLIYYKNIPEKRPLFKMFNI